MQATNNPGSNRGSKSSIEVDTVSDTVTNKELNIIDASLHSMSIGTGEIQVQNNNFLEVSTGRFFKWNINYEWLFKRLIFLGVVLFLLIGGIYLGFKHRDEKEKKLLGCLPGEYNFPYCIKCDYCTSDGSILDCDDNGDCLCKHGFGGRKCDKCKEGFTGSMCDECKPNITGHKCNECKPNYFNYPICQECICNSDGSTSLDCDKDYGNCSCKEGFAGIKCHEWLGVKILIATGGPYDNGINTEIVDVEDSNFSCTKAEPFPVKLRGATGGLMKSQKPFICGGEAVNGSWWDYSKDCYQLTEAGSWAKDQTAKLNTARGYIYGSVVIDDNLYLAGGWNGPFGNYLRSIEMLSPDATAQTLSVQLPTGFNHQCQVPWDSETIFVIGGWDGSRRRDVTYFINVKTNQLTSGPSLNNARSHHACGELQFNGKAYIIVTGDYTYDVSRSTEVLDKNNVGQGWQKGDDFDLPVDKIYFQMVSSPEKKTLYAIGGWHRHGSSSSRNDVYKFNCSGAIHTCKWTMSKTTLRYKRSSFVAIPIPNTLADKLCK